ncbi:hypothetical protein ACH5RR_027758 [Cinchona calisaya]|uniref:Uncharacterized protein n=1 Tax=Cinchona calisaya TaxID=153742 RepID=A0ABD2YQ29_9GENT
MAHSRSLQKPVFAVTNLGTRIALAVSQCSTVGDFKRKFEMAHLNCFPELGKIRVTGLKVWKKSCFYYLSESFPLKHAFQGAKVWFLHIGVCQVQGRTATKKSGKRFKRKKWEMKKSSHFKTAFLAVPRAFYFLRRKKNKCSRARKNATAKCSINRLEQRRLLSKERALPFASRTDGKWGKLCNLSPAIECPSETMSGTISVSGIINRYFSSCDEVISHSTFSFMELQPRSKELLKAEITHDYNNLQIDTPSTFAVKTPPQAYSNLFPKPSSTALKDTFKKDVGARLIEASINLGLSTSKQNPALSLCKVKDGKSGLSKLSNTPIRSLIFELTDEDD